MAWKRLVVGFSKSCMCSFRVLLLVLESYCLFPLLPTNSLVFLFLIVPYRNCSCWILWFLYWWWLVLSFFSLFMDCKVVLQRQVMTLRCLIICQINWITYNFLLTHTLSTTYSSINPLCIFYLIVLSNYMYVRLQFDVARQFFFFH